jgi:peptidoglycan/xylan/chitin deacetylase (PgdA/CDA1 family)
MIPGALALRLSSVAPPTVCSLASVTADRTDCAARTDQERTARLLFAAELASGALDESSLCLPAVRRATRVGPIPPRALRAAQLIARRAGLLDYERRVAAPLIAARNAALGERAVSAPRLLVRMDEFPHYRAWDEPARFGTPAFERFHEIMSGAGVPYLTAALPRVSRSPLSPRQLGSRPLEDGEVEMLGRLAGDGVAIGLHGLDHRTRHPSPRRHSELCGLDERATEELLERALGELAGHGLPVPDVFVAPYNRFDAAQLPTLGRRFAVVCGGPESIGTLGFQRPPQWRGGTVYLPAYAPFYGRAAEVSAALARTGERIAGLWTPVVLHWGWEADAGWGELEALAERLARWAVPWQDFLDAVERSDASGGGA